LAKKTFTTTIEEEIQKEFREKCSKNDVKMNEVLEAFMTAYSNGEFEIERTYKVIRSKK